MARLFRLPAFLRPASAGVEPVRDPAQVARLYQIYQPRVMLWSIVGYAMFYFVRKNLSIAMPVMGEQLGIHKADLGLFLTLHGLLYGVSKFANGVIGDRAHAPTFMALGLVCSAGLNIAFGMSSTLVVLGLFWMLNGWFQGMGFPPCARLLTHWFSPRVLATRMSVWNTSHSIGAGAVVVLCGYLVEHFNNWRLCFFVPAALAITTAVLLLIFLRDTPESVGLPEVSGTEEAPIAKALREDEPDFRALLWERVFRNRYIWVIAVANFFVYTIRYAVLDWGPTMLKESRGITLSHAGWIMAAFEVSGLVGMLASGWITDRVFGGRGARTCVFSMVLCGAALFGFWRIPPGHMGWSTALLMTAGFFIYGPQALVGISVANLATKRAAATAVGLTGMFGYASGILSGWGLGVIADRFGWSCVMLSLLGVSGAAVACFLAAWRAPRDGYDASGIGN